MRLIGALLAVATLVAPLFGCTSTGPEPSCAAPSKSVETKSEPPKSAPREVESKQPQVPPDRFARVGKVTFSMTYEIAESLPSTLRREQLTTWVVPAPDAENSWLALDEHPARHARGRRLHVSDLLNEDVELSPGFHFLFFLDFSDESQVRVQPHAFSLDVESRGLPRAPGCGIFTPHSTVNGEEAAQQVDVLVIPFVGDVNRGRLLATGPDYASRTEFSIGEKLRLVDPPSGDIELLAECFDGDELIEKTSRIITINRDAPSEAAE